MSKNGVDAVESFHNSDDDDVGIGDNDVFVPSSMMALLLLLRLLLLCLSAIVVALDFNPNNPSRADARKIEK